MFFLLVTFALPSIHSQVVHVTAVWRHGDRAPGGLPYPTDPYNETFWPRGWNQLTNIGIRQAYELGQWLRTRYAGKLLAFNFKREEIFIRSTDSERAMDSAAAVAAGLFPAEADRVWKTGVSWQPVPIHTNGVDRKDALLKPTSIECPAYDRLFENHTQLDNQLTQQYSELFRFLTEKTGMAVNATNADKLYDIKREIANSLTPPEWVTNAILDQLAVIKHRVRTAEFDTPEKAKMMGGYLLADIIGSLNSTKPRKAHFYSTHEGTVMALLHVLGTPPSALIPYSACVLIELHNINGHHIVQIWYNNGTNADSPQQLKLEKCDMNCPLEQFTTLLAPQSVPTIEQLDQLCGVPKAAANIVAILPLLLALVFN